MRSLALVALLVAACGGGQAFTLSAADNDPAALARALATERPAPPRQAVAYLALAGGGLAALPLPGEGRPLWTVPAQVDSRIVVCGSFLALREGDALVARDVQDGRALWTRPAGKLAGLAGDEDRVYTVEELGAGGWRVVAEDRAGARLWAQESKGRLGAPAARGGLVYLPFLEQWLHILDGGTGQTLARVRQDDEAVSWVRATPDGVFYGARSVIALDARAASGKRDAGRVATLPDAIFTFFPTLLAHHDAFAPRTGYGARDRTRVLWSATREPFSFRDGRVTLLAQRALFGLDARTGEARWAYLSPRSDLVSAEDTGASIVTVAADGEIAILDRAGGSVTWTHRVGSSVLGATIDGVVMPVGAGVSEDVDESLAAIALDRDARLGPVKLFAIDALALREGAPASAALLRVLLDEQATGEMIGAAGYALRTGGDPETPPLIVQALAVHTDAVAGTTARSVDLLARALPSYGGAAIPGATEAVVAHLEDPATPEPVRRDLATVLVSFGADAVPALASFVLLHRCDARWLGSTTAVVDALTAMGEREVLRHVAAAPDTAPELAAYIGEKLP